MTGALIFILILGGMIEAVVIYMLQEIKRQLVTENNLLKTEIKKQQRCIDELNWAAKRKEKKNEELNKTPDNSLVNRANNLFVPGKQTSD